MRNLMKVIEHPSICVSKHVAPVGKRTHFGLLHAGAPSAAVLPSQKL
jgi:hypothetical protein